MSDLAIETISEPTGIVVKLVGSADLGGSATLDRQILILTAQHPKNVVFDLSRLEFISSLCMGSLVRFNNSCKHWGGKVSLAAATKAVDEALRRARLNQVFTTCESVEKGLEVAS
jgi:anti-anti-sigma factor